MRQVTSLATVPYAVSRARLIEAVKPDLVAVGLPRLHVAGEADARGRTVSGGRVPARRLSEARVATSEREDQQAAADRDAEAHGLSDGSIEVLESALEPNLVA